MQKLKAIIIDDEASARENLELLLHRFCPDVVLLGAFSNLVDGVEYLKKNKIDVVFLDVDMPNYAGYEISKLIDPIEFEIVFITAYNEYAVKAFELSAVDYLLKPVEIERLKEAVNRVKEQRLIQFNLEKYRALENQFNKTSVPQISVLDKGTRIYIPIHSIVVIEASGAYASIHTEDNKNYIVSKNLSQLEKEFQISDIMFRSHKSWIININKIKSINKSNYQVNMENNIIAKISRYRMDAFKKALHE